MSQAQSQYISSDNEPEFPLWVRNIGVLGKGHDRHNHALGNSPHGHTSATKLTDEKYAQVIELLQCGMPPRQILHQTNDGSGSLTSTGRTFKYQSQMPPRTQYWIRGHNDIIGDGNCGFRVIAQYQYGQQERWADVRCKTTGRCISTK